jgi:hypothetical protein
MLEPTLLEQIDELLSHCDHNSLACAWCRRLNSAKQEIQRLQGLIVEWYEAHQTAEDIARNIDAAIALVNEARNG